MCRWWGEGLATPHTLSVRQPKWSHFHFPVFTVFSLAKIHSKEYEHKQLESINMHVSIYNKQKYLSISQYLRLSNWFKISSSMTSRGISTAPFFLPRKLIVIFAFPPSFTTVLFSLDWSKSINSWISGRYSPVAVVPSFLGIHGLINVRICRTHNVF